MVGIIPLQPKTVVGFIPAMVPDDAKPVRLGMGKQWRGLKSRSLSKVAFCFLRELDSGLRTKRFFPEDEPLLTKIYSPPRRTKESTASLQLRRHRKNVKAVKTAEKTRKVTRLANLEKIKRASSSPDLLICTSRSEKLTSPKNIHWRRTNRGQCLESGFISARDYDDQLRKKIRNQYSGTKKPTKKRDADSRYDRAQKVMVKSISKWILTSEAHELPASATSSGSNLSKRSTSSASDSGGDQSVENQRKTTKRSLSARSSSSERLRLVIDLRKLPPPSKNSSRERLLRERVRGDVKSCRTPRAMRSARRSRSNDYSQCHTCRSLPEDARDVISHDVKLFNYTLPSARERSKQLRSHRSGRVKLRRSFSMRYI